MNEEQIKVPEIEEITATRVSRTQARVASSNSTNNSNHNESNRAQLGMRFLVTVLVLFLLILTAGMSFLIYLSLENEKKYDVMEKQIALIEQHLPNAGVVQETDNSKMLKPATTEGESGQVEQEVDSVSGVVSPNPNGTKTYIVQSGDSLSTVAAINGVTIDELRSANNLTDDVLEEGQVLKISGATSP